MKCLACGSDFSRTFEAREMMFGRREAFRYRECGGCGMLQIERVPENLSDYYPQDYYSLRLPPARMTAVPAIRKAWARWLVKPASGMAERMARALYRKSPFFTWARLTGCRLDAAILDVGCGSGGLLRRMQRYGFSRLTGVDPYAPVEVDLPGLKIMRGELAQAPGRHDLVMFHHVLEHVGDPIATLGLARKALTPGGRILVRIPVAGSHACREYGGHWFNLDAPRHLAIPSVRALQAMAGRAGLRVAHTEFDSTEASFLMSENYRRGIPMREAPQPSRAERKRCRRLAEALNRKGDGDLGVFVLAAD